MRLKTYIVSTMAEAIPMIKRDLGEDALILNTKKIKTGGFLGLFKKNKLEVTAAIDPGAAKKRKQIEELEAEPPAASHVQQDASADLINELKNIKQFMVHQINQENLPKELQVVRERLTQQEVVVDVQEKLIEKLMTRDESETAPAMENTWQVAREKLISMIVENQTQLATENPRITCFIGPTGVGKTTTIAKIAASHTLNSDKKVGLITADTYRIAAVEQLKTYGGILNIPVQVIESAADLTKAIEDFEDCDIILIDTAGRNYQQTEYVEELKNLLPADSNVQVHLVLSLTAKYEDMKRIIDNFQSISPNELLLTKKDETGSSGAILNLICHYDIPIRYIANGQNVPDDLLALTPELVADFVMGEENHA
ncbi:flagellar biosynthesis protein FlhF [Planococcus donghaensis]|uniref:Flagellar biosynthesis protein FlhF n=1 Tax=Planococcus donghaensis TaxID=414778 RepID=A0A1C7EKI7_9BACL|nr:flagellar biosynthesis protein FlhF [Planococcus donghaensis]ANU24573.1 flagellar biosynthesis protein FlhF [Planococcus donghaensis]